MSVFPRKSLWYGSACGLAYGLGMRALAVVSADLHNLLVVMGIGFIFFGPLAIGAITIAMTGDRQIAWARALFWPWFSVALGCLFTVAVQWEGAICVAMYLPVALLLASLGGGIGRIVLRFRSAKMMLASIAILPFASQLIENQVPAPLRQTEVHSSIRIQAGPEAVWREIKSVRLIAREEMPDSWVHRIGFPRPLEAVVDTERLGGVRKARFERGVVFDESIDTWNPPRDLGFSIHAEPIAATSLDEHVTIGGPYFDVLHGEYTIEDLGGGEVNLHLTSRFRLSTHFNFYAALWTGWVMQRIQGDILGVIARRAEG